ncbi:DUF2059 domain-containing protein [Undibacterium sp. TC4M20W]|uniref:DUF2059 domain-containing protein n=1 Tax=Undibacterium sp. TC4M20W TaxID=3413052 RepID=UPI003BF287B8
MKISIKLLPVIFLAFISMPIVSQAASETTAKLQTGMTLARLMYLGEGPLIQTEEWARAGSKNDKSQDFLNCFRESDLSEIHKFYAKPLSDLLSISEMNQAILFYQSPAGKKQLEISVTTLKNELRPQKDRDVTPAYSSDDLNEFKKFSESSVGRKLSNQSNVNALISVATSKKFLDFYKTLEQKCRKSNGQ